MIPAILSLLVLGADALLFPLNNGAGEPEPELIFACPPPRVPQFGSIKCDYSMFELSCVSHCDSGFQFEDGANVHNVKCDLFEGYSTQDIPKCVRIGVITPEVTNPPTNPPSTATNCVRSMNDCFNRLAGDYAFCDNCRMFATCAGSGFYVRNCPGISVFDATIDRCVDYSSSTLCKL